MYNNKNLIQSKLKVPSKRMKRRLFPHPKMSKSKRAILILSQNKLVSESEKDQFNLSRKLYMKENG